MEELYDNPSLPTLVKYADKLREHGVSPATFERPQEQVVEDLIGIGLPSLAARDIVHFATAHFDRARRNRERPMAVFWDIENMPIPKSVSGTDLVDRLKRVLNDHGRIVQLNAYMSVTQAGGAEDKRAQLQQSGVKIHDTPHARQKEVADKMIIVDAVRFAYTHQSSATVVLITKDLDFSYMLSTMQELSDVCTVLVSSGMMKSTLGLAATVRYRWEADIMAAFTAPEPLQPIATAMERVASSPPASMVDLESLTHAEMEEDSVAIVVKVIGDVGGESKPVMKSTVSQALKDLNDVAYADKASRNKAIQGAIASGAVTKTEDEHGNPWLQATNTAQSAST